MHRPIQVLHVDDQRKFAEMHARYVQQYEDGIEVTVATSPAEGMDLLRREDVDCIVSDYEMPGTDGIEFLGTVREKYPALPFIFYTRRALGDIPTGDVEAGITDYVQKGSGRGHLQILATRITTAVDARH